MYKNTSLAFQEAYYLFKHILCTRRTNLREQKHAMATGFEACEQLVKQHHLSGCSDEAVHDGNFVMALVLLLSRLE